jgi:PAS domain S-box-containing protein
MFGLKSPSLLIRISHLIFIQVLFVFSALALVIFYPEAEHSIAKRYSDLSRKVEVASGQVVKLLESAPDLNTLSPYIILDLDDFVNNNKYLSNIDIVYSDSAAGKDTLIRLASSDAEDYYIYYSDSLAVPHEPIAAIMALEPGSFAGCVTADGAFTNYFVRPAGSRNDYALILRLPNYTLSPIQNNQAYLLLLLFLISALISLLIIHLISEGVKRPLNKLTKGFENMAAGNEFYIEESGDRQIRSLTQAFNEMSKTLVEKQRELKRINRELLQANKNLRESESILTKLVDYSPDAIIVTDLDDQIIIYNQAAARDFGYTPSNMMGKRITNLIAFSNGTSKVASEQEEDLEMQEVICRRKDNTRFPSLLVSTPLGPEKHEPLAMLYFIKNISESKNYQEMILKLERVATRGKMARDIAHEINNYLAILQGNLELLPVILAKNEKDKFEDKVKLMRETVGKISNFTDGLTRFSDSNSEFAREDLNQLVENLVAFLKPQNKFDEIALCTNLADNLPLVEIDASQIQLLLVNLIDNAADSVSGLEGSQWIVVSTLYDEDSQSVTIKVADSGSGIGEENISQLFVNRFSTKKDGTGLGLITCRNVVDNHRGEISYHASDESKSIFAIRIPVKRSVDGNPPKMRETDPHQSAPV